MPPSAFYKVPVSNKIDDAGDRQVWCADIRYIRRGGRYCFDQRLPGSEQDSSKSDGSIFVKSGLIDRVLRLTRHKNRSFRRRSSLSISWRVVLKTKTGDWADTGLESLIKFWKVGVMVSIWVKPWFHVNIKLF